jgi:hypothetical protein
MYSYAGSTNCFYTNNAPDDAVEITDERYQELLAGMAEGKVILSKAGHPEFYVPTYSELRAAAYPPIVDQLDTIFHGGLDAWKAEIQAVKTQFPKEVA